MGFYIEILLNHHESVAPPPLLRTNLTQLKDAYTKLFEDYNELKQESKNREVTTLLSLC